MDILLNQDDVIWGFDFLPDGNLLFTERGGKLYHFDPKTKKATVITGTPEIYVAGQGGLLDVRVHPSNGYIYLTYSRPVKKNTSTTAFGRGKLSGNKLTDFKELFSAVDPSTNDHHYGSRIEFDGKGHVFITVGERGERKSVQKLSTHLGKVIRLKEDGQVPTDNPYVGEKNAKPEIWSRGIRSPQGLTLRPDTQELWLAEMGPRGGDEINLIKPKANYGWPDVTYGREYYGPKIGEGKTKSGVEDPIVYWVPSISPSAMTFWKDDIWLATLSGQHLRQIKLQGQKVIQQTEYFQELDWRYRNVRPGPDGHLYFSTDEGKLGRIIPQL
jgi:glucose/arabinose dehydrogenase